MQKEIVNERDYNVSSLIQKYFESIELDRDEEKDDRTYNGVGVGPIDSKKSWFRNTITEAFEFGDNVMLGITASGYYTSLFKTTDSKWVIWEQDNSPELFDSSKDACYAVINKFGSASISSSIEPVVNYFNYLYGINIYEEDLYLFARNMCYKYEMDKSRVLRKIND